MLTISRKLGQSFYIGKDIKITLSQVSGQSAKVSIEASKNIKIIREELFSDVERSEIDVAVIQACSNQ